MSLEKFILFELERRHQDLLSEDQWRVNLHLTTDFVRKLVTVGVNTAVIPKYAAGWGLCAQATVVRWQSEEGEELKDTAIQKETTWCHCFFLKIIKYCTLDLWATQVKNNELQYSSGWINN